MDLGIGCFCILNAYVGMMLCIFDSFCAVGGRFCY